MSSGGHRQVFVVAGTGTGVGKTWAACRLASELAARGLDVAARKPAQSFSPGDGPTDAELLAAATGETMAAVSPPWRWYPVAMAPPMAAERLGAAPFTVRELLSEVTWPAGPGVTLVELAGGLGSPQAGDGDGVAMVDQLAPAGVLLVAGAGLGTLSHVSLAGRALAAHRVVVFLNRFDPGAELHGANLAWLTDRAGLTVTTTVPELAAALLGGPNGGPGGSGAGMCGT